MDDTLSMCGRYSFNVLDASSEIIVVLNHAAFQKVSGPVVVDDRRVMLRGWLLASLRFEISELCNGQRRHGLV